MSDRNKAFELQERLQENGVSDTSLLEFIINNYLGGSQALEAMQYALVEFGLEDEEDEDEPENDDQYEVCTFDGEEAASEVYEGGLSYQRALVAAMQLFDSGKFFGVQVVSNLPEDELDPICWIKTKQVEDEYEPENEDFLNY